jgi:hypothetical protein
MIHDKTRVEAIRARMNDHLQRIEAMKAKIVKGNLDALDVARNQTEDIGTFFLADLDRQDRSPAQEAFWLSGAERMLQVWAPYIQKTEQQFAQYGDHGIQIIG